MSSVVTPMPLRFLPRFGNAGATDDMVRTISMLLYFDHVFIPILAPFQMGDDEIRDSRVARKVTAACPSDDRGNISISVDALSVGEALALKAVSYLLNLDVFMREYRPLFNSGLMQLLTLEHILGSPSVADYGIPEELSTLDLFRRWHEHQMTDVVLSSASASAETDVLGGLTDGGFSNGAAAHWTYEYLRATNPDELRRRDLARPCYWSSVSDLFALFMQVALTASCDVFADSERTVALTNGLRTSAGLPPPAPSDKGADILSAALVQLPVSLPRSADAFLNMRDRLQDDLDEMRELLNDIASDVRGGDGDTVRSTIESRIAVPVRRLRRRLDRPERALLRNLLSDSGLVSATIGVAVDSLSMLPNVWSHLLGASVALGVTAARTKFRRDQLIAESGVAFFYKSFEG